MTYYTNGKCYGRARMHDNMVPLALRALGTKTTTGRVELKFLKHGYTITKTQQQESGTTTDH